MNWTDMIFRRKSVRSYTGEPVDEQTLDRIRHFIREAKPLDPSIRIEADIIPKSDARCILPWLTPQLIAIFSEEAAKLEGVEFEFNKKPVEIKDDGVIFRDMGKEEAPAAVNIPKQYSSDELRRGRRLQRSSSDDRDDDGTI